MWATLALERSASSRRSAEALDETAGWSAAGRSRRVGGGRAVRPRESLAGSNCSSPAGGRAPCRQRSTRRPWPSPDRQNGQAQGQHHDDEMCPPNAMDAGDEKASRRCSNQTLITLYQAFVGGSLLHVVFHQNRIMLDATTMSLATTRADVTARPHQNE